MRDIVFVIAFIILFFLSLKRPFVAVSLWIWSGLFVPSYWLYGFASSYSYNTMFALSTMLGYLFYKRKPEFKVNIIFIFVLLFFIQTTITSFYALAPSFIVWGDWENFSKVILFFIFTSLIIRSRNQFNFFIWAIVLSISFMGFVEGLKYISSGGYHHIKGPSGNILSDNNHMAVALCMTLPLISYLIPETNEKLIKNGLRVMFVICIIAILGTYSRGGFIGLVIVLGYFLLKTQHKIKGIITIVFVGILASVYVSSSWINRMDSIDNPMDSGSFTTRINSWKIHTLMALDRPFVGGGFKGALMGEQWRRLAVDIDKFDFIPTPPPGNKGWAAHSIYFQALGDQGFPGLFLFLSIIFLCFMKLTSIEKYYLNLGSKEDWHSNLAKMIKVSLMAYCVAGAAVSLAYVELLYAILSATSCLYIILLIDKKIIKTNIK